MVPIFNECKEIGYQRDQYTIIERFVTNNRDTWWLSGVINLFGHKIISDQETLGKITLLNQHI